MSGATYLVTGGAGFIGSNFIHYLFEKNDHIHVVNYDNLTYAGNLENLLDIEKKLQYSFVKGDICSRKCASMIFKKFCPDYIINFAAESHVDRSITNPGIFMKSNIMGVQNLLQTSLKYGVKKYLQVSTDEVYGSLGKKGLFRETTPLAPRSPYSASKACADLLTESYFHTFNLPVNITRCSNNYGPYQFPEKLIPLTISKCLIGKKIPVFGDGLNIRDWIHVKDHCSAIDLVLHEGVPGEVYNIGAKNEQKNIMIIKMIIQIITDLCPDLNVSEDLISYIEDRKGHDRRYAIDSTKIQKSLCWKPSISFEDGLKRTVLWYLDHGKWLNSIVSKEYLAYYKKG